jgi:hypothetical protein
MKAAIVEEEEEETIRWNLIKNIDEDTIYTLRFVTFTVITAPP